MYYESPDAISEQSDNVFLSSFFSFFLELSFVSLTLVSVRPRVFVVRVCADACCVTTCRARVCVYAKSSISTARWAAANGKIPTTRAATSSKTRNVKILLTLLHGESKSRVHLREYVVSRVKSKKFM